MKAFFLAVAATFVGGLLLIATGLLVNEALDDNDRTYQESPEGLRHVAQKSVRLVEHARVEGMQNLTVRGIVQNIGPESLNLVELRINLRVAGAKVNECEGMIFDEFAPGTRQSFQIVCKDAVGTGLPAGTTYDLVIDSAG